MLLLVFICQVSDHNLWFCGKKNLLTLYTRYDECPRLSPTPSAQNTQRATVCMYYLRYSMLTLQELPFWSYLNFFQIRNSTMYIFDQKTSYNNRMFFSVCLLLSVQRLSHAVYTWAVWWWCCRINAWIMVVIWWQDTICTSMTANSSNAK